MNSKAQETVLSNLTDNLVDSFFDSGASSSNVLLPGSDEPPKTTDDTPAKANLDKQIVNPTKDSFTTDELIGDLLANPADIDVDLDVEPPADKKGPGRPKKVEEAEFDFNSLISDDVLLPFENDEAIKTVEDLKELIKANKAEERRKGQETALKSYKETLPESINMILDYAENGGQDFDNFLKALGQVRQVTDLSVDKPADQKEIIRQYYSLHDWSPEDIEDQIETLIDLGEEKLKSAASKLKPKLDQHQQEMVQSQLDEAKRLKERQEQAQRAYVNNLTTTLKKGTIGDMKLTKEEQKDLYSALVEERYQGVDGSTTNRLGALLDKIQFLEPNYELLAETMMLLTDPKAYKAKIREEVKKEVTADTVKKIKSEQGLAKTGSNVEPPSTSSRLKRLDTNFKNPFA